MKNLVITGATKGIGKGILLKFAEEGYNVIFCARNAINIQVLQAELQSIYPNQLIEGVVVDVSNKDAVIAFGKYCIEKFQTIDILVNNAGIYQPGNVIDEADGIIENQLNTNLLSAYHLTRVLVPTMIQRKSGHIFNICSIAGLQAYPGGGSYSISKFALLGMNHNLRQELLPHGIKVTAVIPGATMSDSWAGVDISPERIMDINDIALSIWSASQLSPQAVVESIVLRPLLGDL